MGTCQNICKQQVTEKEFTMMSKARMNKQVDSDRDSRTDPHFSQHLFIKEDSIADELNCQAEQNKPEFIRTKTISCIIAPTQRNNRFLNDLEQEVKFRIKQIQMEEREELFKAQQKFEEEQKLKLEKKSQQEEESEKHQQELDNQFSFQNSMKQSQTELHQNQQTSNPYLPRQTSQFAPKRQQDADTVSQKSQISKTPTYPVKDLSPKSEMMRKSALKKIMQSREELASNNASIGSKTMKQKQRQQLDALEKMFSDYFSQDEKSQSGSHKSKRSVKSILKNHSYSQRSISMSKNSIKSTHTVFKPKQSKKVRFSNDTNFNNERKGLPKKIKQSWWDW